MSDEDVTRRIRIERLDSVYRILFDQVRHEDERLTGSYNLLVLVQSILLAGLVPLNTLNKSLYSSNVLLLLIKGLLPVFGILLCINSLFAIHRRVEAMKFWADQIYRIEADGNFVNERYDGGLCIFTARRAHMEKKLTRYPIINLAILEFQRYFIGILFLIVWILALTAQLYSYFLKM